MKDTLLEYMLNRYTERPNAPSAKVEPGPVITLSRETGCGAAEIAEALVHRLNALPEQGTVKEKWGWIDRQILEKSAEELHLDPSQINKVFSDRERGTVDQIVEALSGHYHKSDSKIRKTLQEVIRQFAEKGYVVIVGRGGATVSHDIKRSLHIRLEAPLEWRIEAFARKYTSSLDFSRKFIIRRDIERDEFNNRVTGEKTLNLLYDCVINRSRFTVDEIVELVFRMASFKGIY